MQLEPLIELRGVYKRFTTASVGSYTALRDLSFHAGPGVFCAVVGPAGCGKSTTVLAILRVLYHSSKPDVGVILMRPADRKVLFLRRRWAPYRGRWGLPGGFVAYGEHPEDAAVREVHEETGLQIQLRWLIGMRIEPYRRPEGLDRLLSLYYVAELLGGEERLNEESSRFAWYASTRHRHGSRVGISRPSS